MPPEASQPVRTIEEQNPAEPVFLQYSALVRTLALSADFGLGGKLLYAGEIDASGRNRLFAANIAGAASLAASADPAVQRQAIRDGVVDFLVTSLEEALRILKNEVRKRHAVSVGVAIDPKLLIAQMLDRGVLPDLPPSVSSEELGQGAAAQFLAKGARQVNGLGPDAESFISWRVDREPARWLPRLDACVQAIVPAGDLPRQRWLRLAPRYLGRLAQKQHGVALSASETAHFRASAADLIRTHSADGTQGVLVEIQGELVL